MHVAYNAPHFPLQAPESEVAPFRETGRFTEGVSRIYGMNARMDRGIARLLDTLEAEGLRENTLVLFTSDNGPQFGGQGDLNTTRYNGHFNGCKGNVYEGGIRVPAIVRWPAGLPGGAQRDAVVHFTDWLPTLLAAAGIKSEAPLPLDGRNALPLLRGECGQVDPQRFWQWNRYTPVGPCNAAMRDGPWKLLRPAIPEAMRISAEDGEWDRRLKYEPDAVTDICRDPEPERTVPAPPPALLFNVEEDPWEQHDVSTSQPDRVRRMEAELDRWFHEVERDRRIAILPG